MTATTKTEKGILLRLVKDFTQGYNPSNLAKQLAITRVGTYKALKELERKGLVNGKQLGKATFYTVDLSDEYSKKNIEILLMEQSRNFDRWIDEFRDLYNYVDIVILFGSIIKNAEKASDIDLLLVFKKENNNKINEVIRERNQILTKRVHPIKQTKEDLLVNIKKRDEVVLNAIKEGVVLYGFEKLMEILKNVTSRE